MTLTRPWMRGYLFVPIAVVLGLCAVYLITAPQTGDHAAQAFRTELFQRSGTVIWDNYWFGGHYLPSYSLLSPALGDWIGFRLTAVLSALGTVVLFGTLVERHWGRQTRAGSIWFAAAATISLFSGQTTFALGVLFASAAVFTAQRSWRVPSLFLAASVTLASPVAALFLACLGLAHGIARWPDRRGLQIAAASFAPAVIVAFLFPGGGNQPYVFSSFLPCLLVTFLAAYLVPRKQKLIRTGLIIYAVALILSFAIATPMGGNANRLGVLLIGPLFLISVQFNWRKHRLAIAVLIPLIVIWQVSPVISNLRSVDDAAATQPRFYAPLESTLDPLLAKRPARLEVLPVASHWESADLAPNIALARGWERQTDRQYNGLFYRPRLGPQQYRRWLDHLAVGYVAVPRARLDYAGLAEATLIKRGVNYLIPVPTAGPWLLYKVKDARPMVEAPARLKSLSTDGFQVAAPMPGTYIVRIRSTPYWEVTAGSGSVAGTPSGWTEVSMPEAGVISVDAHFRPLARINPGKECGN